MQSTVVVSQPGGYAAPVVMPVPPNHMALAWITCLFCFWPLGIAAIIKSSEVRIVRNHTLHITIFFSM